MYKIAQRLTLVLVLPVLSGLVWYSASIQAAGNQVVQAQAHRWIPTLSLRSARADSCSVLLADGRVMVMGGAGAEGPLASVEISGTAGAFSYGSPMANPRQGHACAALADGTVLVAGGITAGGGISNAAELYDPAGDTWTPVGNMSIARARAAAVVLNDGRVLLAGGDIPGTVTNTLEIYDPATRQFTQERAALTSPRNGHAAVMLSDGRVLVAGGSDGSNALDTVDVFDPVTGAVTAGVKLSTPRVGLSATALFDGNVLFAGGSNGKQDLASGEVLDVKSGKMGALIAMGAARRDHLAVSLPDNNTVLLIGGTSNGAPLDATEQFVPWWNKFQPAETLNVGRTGATVTARKGTGSLVVAGGKTVAAATRTVEAKSYATLTSDKTNYMPGETVILTGTGWLPKETVQVTLHVFPTTHPDVVLKPRADSKGNFTDSEYTVQQSDAGVTFYVTSVGLTSGNTAALLTFTDGSFNVTVNTSGPSFTLTWGRYNSNTICSGNPNSSGSASITSSSPFSPGAINNNDSIKFTVPSSSFVNWTGSWSGGTYTPTLPSTLVSICVHNNTNGATGNLTANYTKLASTTSVSSSVNPSNFGQSVTFTAAVSGGGTVNFKDGGTTIGTCNAQPVSGNQATCTTSSLSSGTHAITAEYSGDGNYLPSTGTLAGGQVVNKANTTTAVQATGLSTATVVGEAYTVYYTVTVNPPGGGTPSGTVTVSDGSQSCTGTASAGSCSLTSTTPGAKTITASYAGDTNFNGSSDSVGKSHTVNKAGTTTTVLTGTLGTATVVGESYAVTYTVTANAPGGGTPTGNVTVSDGTATNTCTVAAGSCSLTSTTPGAPKTITATYAGDANFAGSSDSTGRSHTVNKADTTTTVQATGLGTATVVGQPYTVSYTVTVNSPGAGTPGGTVTVSDGSQSCTGTPAAGSCSLTSTTPGAKTITATYAGDTNFSGSSDSVGKSHTVNKADTTTAVQATGLGTATVVGQPYTVSYTVTVNSPGGGTPGGTVTVSDGSQSCTGTPAAGSCSLTSTTPGTKTITATYAGDTNFNGSSDSIGKSHTVNKAGTTTTITNSAALATATTTGQGYTVNYSVAVTGPGAGTPTGNVTVSDGTDTCTALVSDGGCTLTSSTVGSPKTITASYAGDSNFSNSQSAGVNHTVNPSTIATTTTVYSGGDWYYGTPPPGAAPPSVSAQSDAPNGSTITFYLGACNTGTFLTSGTVGAGGSTGVILLTSSLTKAPNIYTLSACYGGQGNYLQSTGTKPQIINSKLVASSNVGKVGLSWTLYSGATSYTIYRSSAPTMDSTTSVTVSSTSYIWTLPAGTYYFMVVPNNATDPGVKTNVASATSY